jgi:hypothetical protein
LRLPAYGSTDAPSKELAAELHRWDAILAAEGRNIEHRNVNGTMSHHIEHSAAQHAVRYRPDKEEYWRQVTLHEPRRRTCWGVSIRRIWRLYAEGMEPWLIADTLSLTRQQVNQAIKEERGRLLATLAPERRRRGPSTAQDPREGLPPLVQDLLEEAPPWWAYRGSGNSRTPIRDSGYDDED